MDVFFKVLVDGEQINFDEAVLNRRLIINPNGIHVPPNVEILRCTDLRDGNGKMIYEKDTLVDKHGDLYNVLYEQGNFIIQRDKSDTACTPYLLSALKINSVIDTLFVK